MKDVIDEPHCMGCKQLWDTEFIVKNISRAMTTRLKKQKEERLFEQELIKLPETQFYLQYDHAIRNDVQHDLVSNIRKLQSLHDERLETPIRCERATLIRKQIKDTERHLSQLHHHINNWTQHLVMSCLEYIPHQIRTQFEQNKSPSNTFAFVSACPLDSCNGFVMLHDWKCGTCGLQTCKQCHKPIDKDATHLCNEDDVNTAKFIMQTSKPCPKCATRIHKINGCDQMWCTLCKTPFSWSTGKIETGAVHNPHFYEWIRHHENQDPRDLMNCEGRPMQQHVITHCGIVFGHYHYYYRYFTTIHRLSVHIQQVEVDHRFSRTNGRGNLDLRLRWLKQEIDKAKMCRILHKRYKETIINRQRIQVLELFITLTNDVFHRLLHCHTHDEAASLKQEIQEIIEYTNNCFKNLYIVYKTKMPNITIVENIINNRITVESNSNGQLPLQTYI